MSQKITTILAGAALSACAFSTSAQTLWQRTYGTDTPQVTHIAPTLGGGVVMAGHAEALTRPQLLLMKVKAAGDTAWSRTFTHPTQPSFSEPGGVVTTSTGGYILSGYNFDGLYRVSALRTDSNGGLLWSKLYTGAAGQFESRGVVRAGGDTTLHLAMYYPDTSFNSYGGVVALDGAGNVAWAKSYQFPANEILTVQWQGTRTADGSIYLSGSIVDGVNTFLPIAQYVMKLDGAGNVKWLKSYTSSATESSSFLQHVSATGDGRLLFAYGAGGGVSAFMVHKLDTAGNLLWAKKFAGTSTADSGLAKVNGMTIGSGHLIYGSSNGDIFNATEYDSSKAWLIRLNTAGDTVWTRAYGGSMADVIQDGTATSANSFVFAGHTHTTVDSVYAFSTDSNGASSCRRIPQTFSISSPTVTVASHNVLVVPLNVTATNYVPIIGYSSAAGLRCPSITITGVDAPSAEPVALSMFPNPASTEVVVQYSLVAAAPVSLAIYHASGAVAAHISSGGEEAAGTHRKVVDVSRLARGVYYCTLVADGVRVTKKLVVQ